MSVTVDANVLVYASNAGDESHEAARGLIERLAAGPDLVYAQLATLMRQHGVDIIYSRDRDFRRYDGITTRDPFAR